jgi:hypothetical protein
MKVVEQVQGAAGQAGVSTEKLRGLLDAVPDASALEKLKGIRSLQDIKNLAE